MVSVEQKGVPQVSQEARAEKSALLGLPSDQWWLQLCLPALSLITRQGRQWSGFCPRVHPRSAQWGQVSVPEESKSPTVQEVGGSHLAWALLLQLGAMRGGGGASRELQGLRDSSHGDGVFCLFLQNYFPTQLNAL